MSELISMVEPAAAPEERETEARPQSPGRESSVRRLLSRAIARLEFGAVCGLAAAAGRMFAIRYLRNPNPLASVRLLRHLGATIGENTTIKGSLYIDNVFGDANATGDLSHLKIGNNCYIGEGVFFDLAGEVVIEDNAVIAGRASFITHAECNRSAYLSRRFPRRCERVVVGRGAWIGFGATVMLGVTIGETAVVGAQSVVLRDADPRSVYVGVPASKLRPVD